MPLELTVEWVVMEASVTMVESVVMVAIDLNGGFGSDGGG